MQENSQAEGDSKRPEKNDRNPLHAAKLLFTRLPVGLRRITVSGLIGFLIVVGIAVLHPSLNERWKFGTDMTLNFLILLAIVVQAYIYLQQWEVMQKQFSHLTVSERAYITLEDLVMVRPLAVDQPVHVRFMFRNGGKTPAMNFRSHHRAIVTNEPIEAVIAKFPIERKRGSGSFLAAGQPRRIECPFNYTLNEVLFNLVANGSFKLLVLSEIEFRDFLGEWQAWSFQSQYDPAEGTFQEADYDYDPN